MPNQYKSLSPCVYHRVPANADTPPNKSPSRVPRDGLPVVKHRQLVRQVGDFGEFASESSTDLNIYINHDGSLARGGSFSLPSPTTSPHPPPSGHLIVTGRSGGSSEPVRRCSGFHLHRHTRHVYEGVRQIHRFGAYSAAIRSGFLFNETSPVRHGVESESTRT